ncbi:MAG: hypothetical protein KKE11_05715 [Gammaproteobacteria bacterium]|nr:hypothetical protein [Gammaproteobacteria bacterium]
MATGFGASNYRCAIIKEQVAATFRLRLIGVTILSTQAEVYRPVPGGQLIVLGCIRRLRLSSLNRRIA